MRRVVAVAYSGGRDSTALLHATLAAARPLGLSVLALHVHHGLSANADRWLAHCAAVCRRWAQRGRPVEFMARRLASRPVHGQSVEAWARDARYRALAEMALAGGSDIVLLAQHRRDQAETVLLQALRGGGVAALSGMPRTRRRDGMVWARPWLAVPRETIDDYLHRHRLGWVDDETNRDPRFARNLLREQVWPALVGAFPDAEKSLAAAAQWAQEAAAALDEWAAVDLPAVSADDSLDTAAWRLLSPARQGNVLRAWLRRVTGKRPPATLVQRLVAELRPGTAMRWPIEGGELRSYRGRLRSGATPSAAPRVAAMSADLSRAGTYDFAEWQGALVVERVAAGGIAAATAADLELRSRSGGERFQSGPGRPPRSLKLQYQAAAVPAWQRTGPIVCHRGEPVFVPGLGIDARALAAPDTEQLRLTWHPR